MIRKLSGRIQGSGAGSIPKCHGSGTLARTYKYNRCAPFYFNSLFLVRRSESYSFDSSALERAAKAAKELERSKFAKVRTHFY